MEHTGAFIADRPEALQEFDPFHQDVELFNNLVWPQFAGKRF
jgi:hypothetical protein